MMKKEKSYTIDIYQDDESKECYKPEWYSINGGMLKRLYSDKEYMDFLENLKDGITYCGINSGNYGTGVIWYNGKYICWEHYGSSANKCTIGELRFIVETIFRDCSEIVECEYSDDFCNYVPIDKKYKGLNLNRKYDYDRVFVNQSD